MKHHFIYVILFSFVLWNCQKDTAIAEEKEEAETIKKVAPTLPLYSANLTDLSEFDAPSEKWKTAGMVYTDFADSEVLQQEEGSGIILLHSANNDQLSTKMKHADLILELDYMLAKGTRAKILFQENYPLLLADSWNKSTADNGAIAENIPITNVSRAPGLWQTLKLQFRAARFDAQGNKTSNARVDYLYLNDVLIQDSVEFTTVSSEPMDMASLVFQVEQGDIAIRDLQWKKLAQQRVKATNITYQLYKDLDVDRIPDFDQLQADTSGTVENFEELESLAQVQDHFGLVFNGDLNIPNDGTYLFETKIDDGGDLYIDGHLVIHNDGEPGMGTERALVDLTKGTHPFKITYYDEVWRAHLEVAVEGPGVEKHDLFEEGNTPLWQKRKVRSLPLPVEDVPVFQRAFVDYGDEKRTHTISIGHPAGLHYSYDLREGTLLKAWKGEFADVSAMWVGRGNDQLLKPLNAVVEFTAGVPLARLNSESSRWKMQGEALTAKGYQVDENGLPVFEYELGEVKFTDRIQPVNGNLQRTLTFNGTKRGDLWYRIARADTILSLKNGWYNIGGQYYLKINSEQVVNLRDSEDGQELLLPVLRDSNSDKVSYDFLW